VMITSGRLAFFICSHVIVCCLLFFPSKCPLGELHLKNSSKESKLAQSIPCQPLQVLQKTSSIFSFTFSPQNYQVL
jgi:hypothetical protein